MSKEFNAAQQAVIETYAAGEYVDYRLNNDTIDSIAGGDGLLAFLIRDLEDVEDYQDALRRLETVRNEIAVAIEAVEALPESQAFSQPAQ